jgi:hypothetical protein
MDASPQTTVAAAGRKPWVPLLRSSESAEMNGRPQSTRRGIFPGNGTIVKRGTYLNEGTVECDVVIVRSDTWYGSGDADDPVEIRDDRAVVCYYINFGSPTERHFFPSASRPRLTTP